MAEQGGYRAPSSPAPVSGPGRLSRRTDGGPSQTTVPMTGMGYGENADYNDMQSSAPLAAAPTLPRSRRQPMATGGAAATPLFAPTQRPDEPVTAGVPFGPGPGPDNRQQKPVAQQDAQMLAKYLPQLQHMAAQSDAPAGFRAFVQFLNGQ